MKAIALRALGVLLLAIPFVPLHAIFGEVKGDAAYVPPGEWVLGLAIFGVVAWLVASVLGDRLHGAADRAGAWIGARRPATLAAAGVLALACVLLAVSMFVFRHRPHLVDSVVQLFQAKIFAAGMTAAPVPTERAFFATLHMVFDASGWYAQYPPGHSLLLVPGVWLGTAWIVPVALTIGTWLALVVFAETVWGRATAIATGALLLLCPFFWFMGASFMNHVSTLFFVSLALVALARWESEAGGPARGRGYGMAWAGLAGLALGAAFLSRPLTALAVGLVLGAASLHRREWRGALVGALGFLAVGAVYLTYNAATTGDPFLPGYVKLWGGAHGLGFHLSPWGEVHTPATGVRNELLDLSLLNVFLFEWPIPALLPLGIALAAGWLAGDRWVGRLTAAFLVLPAVYFFYWHRDAFLGPRYLYTGIAFVVPLTARALLVGWRRLRGSRWGSALPAGRLVRPVDGGALLAALVGLSIAYAALWGIPQRFAIYATGLSSMKVDVVEEARKARLEPGLIFVATSWGNRLLAEIYGFGVPASVAERVYRSSDHCRLQALVDRARREGWDAARLERELESAVVPRETLVSPIRVNGDPTLLLTPDEPLTERCLEEVVHDREGYTLYVPHLVANAPRLDGKWIVARDLHDRNARLSRLHPDRPAYRYRPGGFESPE